MLWDIKEFKKYFDKKFWKAFLKNLRFFFGEIDKDAIVEDLYESIVKRSYYPSTPRKIFNVNKWNWVVRRIPLFELKDYLLYLYCLRRIEDKIAINKVPWTYWGWSFSGVMRRKEEWEKLEKIKDFLFKKHKLQIMFILKHGMSLPSIFIPTIPPSVPSTPLNPFWWVRAYGDFNSNILLNLYSWTYYNLIEFDISNFYDNIRLDILENKIKQIVSSDFFEEVSVLFHFLNYWNRNDNFYNQQTVGLPQDILWECSRILANFYLQEYDEYVKQVCDKYEFKYLRYADDQIIFWNDEEKLEEVLFLCSKKLSEIWLNLNQKKVRKFSVDEFYTYKAFDLFNLFSDNKKLKNKIYLSDTFSKINNIFISGTNKSYIKEGFPIILKALKVNFSLLSNSKRLRFKEITLDEKRLVKYNDYYLYLIFSNLLINGKEKRKILKKLERIVEKTIYTDELRVIELFFNNIWYQIWIDKIKERWKYLTNNF